MEGQIKKIAIILFIFFLVKSVHADSNAILGKWLNENKDGAITIYKIEDKYYGKLSWLKFPDKDGKPKKDIHNPDENLRIRSLIDLVILKDFEYTGDNKWKKGTIYDPKSGNTYSCRMEIIDDNKLKIRGYIGVSIFGRTTMWSKTK